MYGKADHHFSENTNYKALASLLPSTIMEESLLNRKVKEKTKGFICVTKKSNNHSNIQEVV